jgi:probable F420-dependent oxidoreductase
MRVGIVLRNMGSASTRDIILECARAADAEPAIADLWVADHIAIPPDDAEGSGGRYVDPLATLAFIAGATTRIGLGTGVLVLPYRPPLPTAKWVAAIHELSGGRLRFGIGAGWMEPEFRALGVPFRARGRLTDELLDFLDRCFGGDVVEANGQPFLFKPRPSRPPLYVGGSPPHAFRRVLAHGAAWMPMGGEPERLREPIARLRALASERGVAPPEVATMTHLRLDDRAAARAQLAAWASVGITHVVHGARYDDAARFRRTLGALAAAAT